MYACVVGLGKVFPELKHKSTESLRVASVSSIASANSGLIVLSATAAYVTNHQPLISITHHHYSLALSLSHRQGCFCVLSLSTCGHSCQSLFAHHHMFQPAAWKKSYWNSYVALRRFAITGSSDNLIRMWSMEEVYRQAMEAAWGPRTHATPTDSAQSGHTAAVAEDGQEVSQGHPSLAHAHTHCLAYSILHNVWHMIACCSTG